MDVNPTGECADCPMNAFGSARDGGAGKACKEQMQLFILREGSVLPTQISLPPTSLKPWRKYMTRLASKGKSYYAVVTTIGLSKEKSNGNEFSVVVPNKLADLEPAEVAASKAYGQTISGVLNEAAVARARADEALTAAEDADRAASVAAGQPAKKYPHPGCSTAPPRSSQGRGRRTFTAPVATC